jgi:hypothetical protein
MSQVYILSLYISSLRGVVADLSDVRDRGPGFKPGSRPLTFTKAVTEFSEPYTLWGSHALTNSLEFRHTKDVETIVLRHVPKKIRTMPFQIVKFFFQTLQTLGFYISVERSILRLFKSGHIRFPNGAVSEI